MSDIYYGIFIGAGIMVLAIGGVRLFNEWIKITIRNNTRELCRMVNELSRTFNSLSTDVANIEAHSDIMDDEIDSILNSIEQLGKNMAEMKTKIEKLENKPILVQHIRETINSAGPTSIESAK